MVPSLYGWPTGVYTVKIVYPEILGFTYQLLLCPFLIFYLFLLCPFYVYAVYTVQDEEIQNMVFTYMLLKYGKPGYVNVLRDSS